MTEKNAAMHQFRAFITAAGRVSVFLFTRDRLTGALSLQSQ
jgi:hypothetical protein